MEDREARERVTRLEELLAGLDSLEDRVAREQAMGVVQALVELYGAGLERMVSHVSERDTGEIAEALAGDELVAHILLLHDLHPVPLEDRVRGALAEVRPYLESHGGDVQLLGLEDNVVRLALQGSCNGCPSSSATLELAIEEAIHKAAPDVEGIETEGAVELAPPPGPLQLEVAPALKRTWTDVEQMPDVPANASAAVDIGGEQVLFVRLQRSLYAYRPRCPSCGAGLEDAPVDGGTLACTGCSHRYDVRRAGRALDDDLQLEPLPLLTDSGGSVRVALGARTAVA